MRFKSESHEIQSESHEIQSESHEIQSAFTASIVLKSNFSCLYLCLSIADSYDIIEIVEQEEISKGKSVEEALTWEDLTKMKYTWRVASEMLRMYPPVPVNFRRAVQDIEYE
ncbi:cytochrome P450 716B1-like protein [Tanacetum coccineum]